MKATVPGETDAAPWLRVVGRRLHIRNFSFNLQAVPPPGPAAHGTSECSSGAVLLRHAQEKQGWVHLNKYQEVFEKVRDVQQGSTASLRL